MMDWWMLAGLGFGVVVAAVVWASFLEEPSGLAARLGRLALAWAAGGIAFWLIAFGWPGRDVRGVALSAMVGLIVWRVVPIRDLRIVQWALALGAVAAVFFGVLRGGPDSSLAWLRLLLAVGAAIGLIVIRRIPRLGGRDQANPADEERDPHELTGDDGARLVDAIDLQFGSTRPEGEGRNGPMWDQRRIQRANNAPGSFARGVLEVDPAFRSQGPPRMFRSPVVDVLARFSNLQGFHPYNGRPKVHRNDSARDVHGLALRLSGRDVADLDVITLDIDRFVVRSRNDFLVFTRAVASTRLKRVLVISRLVVFGRSTAPAVHRALGRRIDSYLERNYFGIHTFWWDIGSQAVPVRYVLRATPSIGASVKSAPARDGRCKLALDLKRRLEGDGRARFELFLLDGRGLNRRRLLDPVLAWPKDTPPIHVGTVELRSYDADPDGGLDRLGLNPHHLTAGITPSDDEILMARRAAYPEGHVRRLANAAAPTNAPPAP
jgi:hypothetical protein